MRFSIWPGYFWPWDEVVSLVEHCETTGWDGAYLADHFMPDSPDGSPADGPVLECWSTLAALAGRTERLRLGTLVASVTYRHPATIAKAAATIDVISSGRLVLGLGAGWQVNEHAAYGIALGTLGERMDRFDEACSVVTSMLRSPRTTFAGRHYEVTDAPCDPSPVQARLPVLIGAKGPKRGLPIAARHADEWNSWADPETFRERSAQLDRCCEEIGRDPAQIRRSTQALLFLSDDESWLAEQRATDMGGRPVMIGTSDQVAEVVGAYADAGVDELIIPDWTMHPCGGRTETCDRFIEEIAPQFR